MGERTWRGCVVPDDVLYDVERHVWVRLEDDEAVLGMTDVAQTIGGKLVHITWKAPGKIVARGRPLAVIESAKWVGPFPSPLTGEIVANNEAAFARDVLVANRDPYGAGWLVRLRPTRLEEERGELLDAETAFERYREVIDTEQINCFRCAD
jgi:glycine cleavage system H protein